ncbi:MAG TPA: GNAT family N-acetyltransferase [Acidimicrobiales bacterium]|nr:GNAT family N-acetyltransferase [Acidimicrobiales bacterium]
MTAPPRRHDLTLRDGRTVVVRPIEPTDLAALKDAIAHADEDTLRRRFLGGAPPRSEARLAHLVDVDQHERVALVAECATAAGAGTATGVAVARYEPTDEPGVAEPAIVVAPEWRHAGLGTALLVELGRIAIANGYHAFRAAYLADNTDVERLVRASGLTVERRIADGVTDVVLTLPGTLRDGSDGPRSSAG